MSQRIKLVKITGVPCLRFSLRFEDSTYIEAGQDLIVELPGFIVESLTLDDNTKVTLLDIEKLPSILTDDIERYK